MKRILMVLVVLVGMQMVARAQHDLGVGVNYWRVIDDIDVQDVDESGLSYFVSYRHALGDFWQLELGLERLPDQFGEDLYAPQGYLVLGRSIYVAAGIGGIYWDGSFAEDPFYALKAGLALPLPFWFTLDVAAQYRFTDFDELEQEGSEIGTDTVFLGASLRLEL